MTIKHILLCSSLITTLLTGAASADTDTSSTKQWFVGITSSIAEVAIEDISANIGTGEVIGGERDGQLEDTEVDDYTAGFGFSVGRRIGYWQVAAQYIYRYRTDWDVVATTPAIETITNVFTNVETHTLLINAARHGSITQHWSWELGAGMGYVHHRMDSEYIEREVPGVSGEQVFKDQRRNGGFSYNVFAGVTREFGRDWTLNMRTSYIDMAELKAGSFPERPVRLRADQSAVELQFSIEKNL
jgi:opacity protein-like surface antigen